MTDELVAYDPYALPPDDVREPPTRLWEILKKTGPGILVAGTIVGSGELLLTTSLGAKNGFLFLWLILFSCVIKVVVQTEIGRYAISSGKPTLGALQQIKFFGRASNWLLWWWLGMLLCTVFQLGGITGSVGTALDLAFPQFTAGLITILAPVSPALAGYLEQRTEFPWVVLTCAITVALIYHGTYRRIEWLTTLIVVSVTVLTLVAAASLGVTEYPLRWDQVKGGLQFQLPTASIGSAFAVFGITGVGANELFYYPYWCLEKGYARYVGKPDGSSEWEHRARGWIRVMYWDALICMVVFTISTVAFYFMGAAVLHPQGLVPTGTSQIDTLSQMYVAPFGDWTRLIFLLGAAAVLFKTLYLSCAGNSRLTADFLNLIGVIRTTTGQARARWIQHLCLFFPILALGFYIFCRDPQLMVKVGGIAQAATLPMIAFATVYFRYRCQDPRLRPPLVIDGLLWAAVIAISIVAAYTIRELLTQLFAAP